MSYDIAKAGQLILLEVKDFVTGSTVTDQKENAEEL